MLQERENTNTEFEIVKKFFVDPANPKSAEDLAKLGSDAVMAMAQIYATQGDTNKMTEDIREWLTNPQNAETRLEQQLGEVLKREVTTRIFDNYFVGQIHPQGSKIGILSNLIGAYMNTNRIYKGVSPAEAEMEIDSIKWLSEIFGYDTKVSGGNITTGGTTANMEALWVAREKILQADHTNVRKNKKPLYVLASKYQHYSIKKACNMLGLRLLEVADKGFKVDIDSVKSKAERIDKAGGRIAVIIGIAGETETGMVEDLNKLSEVAQKYNAFFHVDAAYGGPYILSQAKDRFSGINKADSITVDPHKMLYTPYSAGCVLFKKESDHLLISKIQTTRYLRNVVARVEGSMGSGGVIATWATKELLGNKGIATLLDHNLKLADYAFKKTTESKILNPIFKPELNTILLGFKKNLGLSLEKYNNIMGHIEETVEEIKPGKTIYISRNEKIDNGKDALRFLANHPYTTEENVDQIVIFLENEVKKYL